jgi:hypothetical protein
LGALLRVGEFLKSLFLGDGGVLPGAPCDGVEVAEVVSLLLLLSLAVLLSLPFKMGDWPACFSTVTFSTVIFSFSVLVLAVGLVQVLISKLSVLTPAITYEVMLAYHQFLASEVNDTFTSCQVKETNTGKSLFTKKQLLGENLVASPRDSIY